MSLDRFLLTVSRLVCGVILAQGFNSCLSYLHRKPNLQPPHATMIYSFITVTCLMDSMNIKDMNITPSNVLQGDVCAYMLQEYKERQDTARRSKQVAFTLPATMRTLCHSIPIINIHSTSDGTIITMREDGAVCCWSPELKPLKTKHMFVCFHLCTFISVL